MFKKINNLMIAIFFLSTIQIYLMIHDDGEKKGNQDLQTIENKNFEIGLIFFFF